MLEKLPSTVTGKGGELSVKDRESVPLVNKIKNEQEITAFKREFQEGLSREQAEKIVKSMNDFLGESNTELKFEYHEELNEYYVTLVDQGTKEIVREIPPKKLLDMYAAMSDYLGILIDKKA